MGRKYPVRARPTSDSGDFSTRLARGQAALRRRLERRDTLIDMICRVNATLEPREIAQFLLDQAASWIPARSWTVVAHDLRGALAALASQGLESRLARDVEAVTAWVGRSGAIFASADLRRDSRVPGASIGAVLGLPLTCRGKVIGVLVGFDPSASAREPRIVPATARALDVLLEAAGVALTNALLLKRTEALSVTDDLTLVYNSRHLHQVLRRETKRAARTGRPLSLLFIDLDDFKAVNDAHGHLCGSRALVEAAAIMRDSARETDVVARYGGDEFALVMPDTGPAGAAAVGERIRRRLSTHAFLADDGLAVHLTAAMGAATLSSDSTGTADSLLQAADAAMYQVKARGKDGLQTTGVSADTV